MSLTLGDELLGDLVPQARGHVDARGGRALLALVLEAAANHRGGQLPRVGGGVGDDEVLAARLAHDARVVAVRVDVRADLAPQMLEHGGRAGEVQPGEVRVLEDDVADDLARRREARLMTPGGSPASVSSSMRSCPSTSP